MPFSTSSTFTTSVTRTLNRFRHPGRISKYFGERTRASDVNAKPFSNALARALAVALLYVSYRVFGWAEPALKEIVRDTLGIQPTPGLLESGAEALRELLYSLAGSVDGNGGGVSGAEEIGSNGEGGNGVSGVQTVQTAPPQDTAAAATVQAAQAVAAEAERLAAALAEATADLEQLRRAASTQTATSTVNSAERLLPFALGGLLGMALGVLGFGSGGYDTGGHLAALARQGNANRDAIVDALALSNGTLAATSLEQHRQLLEGLSLALEQNVRQMHALDALTTVVGAAFAARGAVFGDSPTGEKVVPSEGQLAILTHGEPVILAPLSTGVAAVAAVSAFNAGASVVGDISTAMAASSTTPTPTVLTSPARIAAEIALANRTTAFLKGAAAVQAAEGGALLENSRRYVSERYGEVIEEQSAELRVEVVDRHCARATAEGNDQNAFTAAIASESFRRVSPWESLKYSLASLVVPLAGTLAIPVAAAVMRTAGTAMLLRSLAEPDGSGNTPASFNKIQTAKGVAPQGVDGSVEGRGEFSGFSMANSMTDRVSTPTTPPGELKPIDVRTVVESMSRDLKVFGGALHTGAEAAVKLMCYWIGVA